MEVLLENSNSLYGLPKDFKGDVEAYKNALKAMKDVMVAFISNPNQSMKNSAPEATQQAMASPNGFVVITYPGGFVVRGAKNTRHFSLQNKDGQQGKATLQPEEIQRYIDMDREEKEGPKDKDGKDKNISGEDVEGNIAAGQEAAQSEVIITPEEKEEFRAAYALANGIEDVELMDEDDDKGFEDWFSKISASFNDVDGQKVCEKLAEFEDGEGEDSNGTCLHVTTEAKMEMKRAVLTLAKLRRKVYSVEIDGKKVYAIDESSMTAEEKAVLKCLTVRGQNLDKSIHIAGSNCENEGLRNLKEVGTKAKHVNYGFNLGKFKGKDKLAPIARIFAQCKIIPSALRGGELTPEIYNELEPAASRSKSLRGGQADEMSNDTRGKLFESVHMLTVAVTSGNDKEKAKALKHLVTDIKKACGAASLVNANAILSDYQGDLINTMHDIAGDDCAKGVRDELAQMVQSSLAFNDTIGLDSSMIEGITRPSLNTKPGHREDLVIKLKPDAEIPPRMKKFVSCTDKGCVVKISSKYYKNGLKTIKTGATSTDKSFNQSNPDYEDLENLREDAYSAMGLSEEQVKVCRDAQKKDEEFYEKSEHVFKNATPSNLKSLKRYFEQVKKSGPPKGMTRQQWNKYMRELTETLEEDSQMAQMKYFNLLRAQEAAKNSRYAKGVASNLVALSVHAEGGTEAIAIGSPSVLQVVSTDEIRDTISDSIWRDGQVEMGLGGITINDDEGNALMTCAVRAKTTGGSKRKLQQDPAVTSYAVKMAGQKTYTGSPKA